MFNILDDRKSYTTIGLNETVPENAIPSICDFELIPTTQPIYYSVTGKEFSVNYGTLNGVEVPIATTKGHIIVSDVNGEEKYRKEIPELINIYGVSDEIHSTKIIKRWSDKYYITKEPTLETVTSTYGNNYLHTYEFTEDDFLQQGLPVKSSEISVCATFFYSNTLAEVENSHIWGAGISNGIFYWDEEQQKYYLKVRSTTGYGYGTSKLFFYYPLETPIVNDDFYLAMGLSAGDVVSFEYDTSEFDIFIEKGVLYNTNSNSANYQVTTIDVTPTLEISAPTSIMETMQGFSTTAAILNRGIAGKSVGSSSADYSWIGDGDGTTDYTTIIQNKIDEVHNIDGKGTVYLGKGTYPISNSLILYEDVSLVGTSMRETIIEQTADNTHAVVLSGSYIAIRDLSIVLSGNCTELTGCIYINSDNREAGTLNPLYPENIYVQHANIQNVYLSGNYKFDKDEDGNHYVGDTYDNYKGCGIISYALYFNYANINNCNCYYLYAGMYSSAGSCVINLNATFCRYGLYDLGGYNVCDITGHSYYITDKNGNTISMSESIVKGNGAQVNVYYLMTYDQQWYKKLIQFDGLCLDNKYSIVAGGQSYSSNNNAMDGRNLSVFVEDLGRGNRAIAPFKNAPYHIGSRYFNISGLTSMRPFDIVINNALAGAGVWGSISSNTKWDETNLKLKDVCRYPKEFPHGNGLASIVSLVTPTVDNPVEIVIDFSDRPIQSFANIVIQFDHRYVAEDFTIYFNKNEDGTYDYTFNVVGNSDVVYYCMQHQVNFKVYDVKIEITKALQINNFTYQNSGYTKYTIDYNPNGFVGIVNIGIVSEDYCGRSFLGECGGSVYGDVVPGSDNINLGSEEKEYQNIYAKKFVGTASNADKLTSLISTEQVADEAITPEKLSANTKALLDSKGLNIGYIWWANQDVVSTIDDPFVSKGSIDNFKNVGNAFTVMAASSVSSNGKITADLTASTVTPKTKVGDYDLYNNGDLVIYAGAYGTLFGLVKVDIWKRIPMHEAKENLDGLMSAWDKQQVNKVSSIETAANDAMNLANSRLPIYTSPNPPEGWQTNWLFDQGWYLGGIKKDCGGHPPVINDNHTSWAVLVLNGMATDATSLNHNHRLQIAYDLVNSKIYMRRGWMSDNTWYGEWTEVGAIGNGAVTTEKIADKAVTLDKLSDEIADNIKIIQDGSYFKLGIVTELPEASEEHRGRQLILQSNSGDKIYTCLYNGTVYEWVPH